MEIEDEHIVYLSLGSNEGDRINHLNAAIERIQSRIGVLRQRSNFYSTPPLGFEADSDFINCCLEISTRLSPIELISATQQIELELGRKPKQSDGYASRTIDIDTLLYSTTILQSEQITIPHPRFRDRKFVLMPLCELNKSLIDPITNLTMNQLLANCGDTSWIEIYTENKK
jgi:deoxyguanosine kinase